MKIADNRLKKLSASTISDALDKLGIAGQCFGIKPLSNDFRAFGRAFTIKMIPCTSKKGTVGDFLDDVPPGSMITIDSGGTMDATVWGDILTYAAHKNEIAGTVINGVCRDILKSIELNYPIFSKGVYMRTGKSRLMVETYDLPVNIGGVSVYPGDIIVGDHDGVVVIPKDHEENVIEIAVKIDYAESAIRDAFSNGMRLDEARKLHGYHNLQNKED